MVSFRVWLIVPAKTTRTNERARPGRGFSVGCGASRDKSNRVTDRMLALDCPQALRLWTHRNATAKYALDEDVDGVGLVRWANLAAVKHSASCGGDGRLERANTLLGHLQEIAEGA